MVGGVRCQAGKIGQHGVAFVPVTVEGVAMAVFPYAGVRPQSKDTLVFNAFAFTEPFSVAPDEVTSVAGGLLPKVIEPFDCSS